MFVQLTHDDCAYLLDLINDMDSETLYTSKQREYTIPKLEKIMKNPRTARLHPQDVEYLLDLIDDDDLPEQEQQRIMTRGALIEIQELQIQKTEEMKDIDLQRHARRTKRFEGLK